MHICLTTWGRGTLVQTTSVRWVGPQRASGETKAALQVYSAEGLKSRASQPTTDPHGSDTPVPASVSSPRIPAGKAGPPAQSPGGREGSGHSCFPHPPHPMGAKASTFSTEQLPTPLAPAAPAGWAHAFLMPGHGGAGPGAGGPGPSSLFPQTQPAGVWMGRERAQCWGFQGLDDKAGMGVGGMGQTQRGEAQSPHRR